MEKRGVSIMASAGERGIWRGDKLVWTGPGLVHWSVLAKNQPRPARSKHRASRPLSPYQLLLKWKHDSGKLVYVLASHSHFFMDDIFETPYWQARGVLPGWIVGTAGAVRYALPEHVPSGIQAKTAVYGYLLGTVEPSGEIHFEFQAVTRSGGPDVVAERFGASFVDWCFQQNREDSVHAPPESCDEK
ncbi:MAG: hypothetical protein ACHQ4J_09070 [Candidatus Binatia bacterium]